MINLILMKGLFFKEQIKLNLFPIIAELLNKFGLSWEYIGRTKLSSYNLLAQAKYLFLNKWNFDGSKSESPQKIVFLNILGGHIYNSSIDVCLANLLRSRGHDVSIIIDDQTFPLTPQQTSQNKDDWKRISTKNYYWGANYFNRWGFKVLTVSEVIKNVSYEGSLSFDEIQEASILRHYKVGIIKEDLPGLQNVKQLINKSIKISAALGTAIYKMNPDSVIMSHGIYATWGPAFNILREKQIPVLTYGRGKKAGTSKFNWNCTADWWDVSEEWKNLKNRELDFEEKKAIDAYLASRIEMKNDVFIYNFGGLESKEETLERFKLDPNKTTYSLFTNVLWDAASAQREIVFDNPIQWVIETIKWFKTQPDKQLIVKIHPAEQVIGTNMPFITVLKEAIKDIPDNIRIIEPHEKVNSWSIYSVTDLGIVHTTTVGMELPLNGTPCIVVSKTHYRRKGFTIDIESRNEYFDLLESFNIESIDKEKLKNLSKKYAYLLFERYQMPLNLFDEVVSTDVRSFKFNSLKELSENPTMLKVIDAIENKKLSILV